MASLTPGILLKLLHNVGNKDFKVAGEHRSALLQVIGIVPSLGDDPWKSRGYYLRVSDSKHSAYASVSAEDVELVLSDKIQLGQLIHVSRLDRGSPVPVLCGVKPVPKRRPCIGEPIDLISSDFLNAKKAEVKGKPKCKVKKVVGHEEVKTRRLSIGSAKVGSEESRRLSLDSARKGWDRSPPSKNGISSVSKSKSRDSSLSSNSVIAKTPSEKDITAKLPSISPLKSKNAVASPKLLSNPAGKNMKSEDDATLSGHLNKVAFSFKNWSDSKVLWSSLQPAIRNLGKEVTSYRNVALLSAVRALEEASASEGVIRCMSMFAELCSSQNDAPGPLVEQFLNIYESMQKAATAINTLVNARTQDAGENSGFRSWFLSPEISSTNKNTLMWVQAAVDTDLSKFSLCTKGEKGISNGAKCHYVLIEAVEEKPGAVNHLLHHKQSRVSSASSKSASNAKRLTSHPRQHPTQGTNAERETWSQGSGLKDAANLMEKLFLSSRAWFLNYLESSLTNGFGLSQASSSEIAGLLGQLKRVNQWLDDSFQEGDRVDERIENLRKKLYRFLLDHVDPSGLTG